MMKTALSIVQSVAYRINQSAPASLYGTTNPPDLQWLNLLYKVCEELRQARTFTQSKRVHSFATVDETSEYQLPQDFYAQLLGTQWNTSESDMMAGPASDSMYALILYGDATSSRNYTYRLFGPDENPNSEGGQFKVSPEPGSAQTIKFEYVSRNLFTPAFWEPLTGYTDGDYVFVNGNNYKCKTSGTSSSDDPPSGQTGDIADNTAVWNYYASPYETILADTDLCIFDNDIVELGLEAEWLKRQGGVWEPAAAEYASRVSQAANRYKGSFVGTMGRQSSGPRYRVPYKSWSI